MELMQEVEKVVQEARFNIDAIVEKLEDKIKSLPENDKIKRVSKNAFIMNSKHLLNTCWSPEFYDFKFQYEKIIEKLKSIDPLRIKETLEQIVTNEFIGKASEPYQNRTRIHPQVIKYLIKTLNLKKLKMTTLEVLSQCTVEGSIIKLPNVQLDRKLYLDTKKSLELIGGKWKGGKVAGFVFQQDPTELLNQIASGEKRNLKKEFQFFATPKELAEKLVELAELNEFDKILEPSAGQGAIISAINDKVNSIPVCYELMDLNVSILEKSNLRFNLYGRDFLEAPSNDLFTKIIANPPFSKNQDIDHVMKMHSLLALDGILVSVMSTSWRIGSQKKQEAFKEFLDDVGAEIIEVEAGAFKSSGTSIPTVIVKIKK